MKKASSTSLARRRTSTAQMKGNAGTAPAGGVKPASAVPTRTDADDMPAPVTRPTSLDWRRQSLFTTDTEPAEALLNEVALERAKIYRQARRARRAEEKREKPQRPRRRR